MANEEELQKIYSTISRIGAQQAEAVDKTQMDQVYADLTKDESLDEANVISNAIAAKVNADPQAKSVLMQAADKLRAVDSGGMPTRDELSNSMQAMASGEPAPVGPRGAVSPAQVPVEASAIQMANLPQMAADAEVLAKNKEIPPAMQLLQSGLNMQASAALNSAKALASGYQQEAAIMAGASNSMRDSAAKSAQTEIEYQDTLAKQLERQDQALDKFDSTKIDPSKFWGDMSTPNKIMMGLGLAMSAYGGKAETALSIINKAVERDIAIQQANADLAKETMKERSNLISQIRATVGDKRQAEEIYRNVAYKSAEILAKSVMASTNSELAKQKGMEIIGGLQVQQAEALQKATEAGGNRAIALMESAAEYNGRGPIPWDVARSRNLISDKDVARIVPGYGILNEGESVEKVSDGIVAYKNGVRIMEELKNLTDKYGGEVFSGKTKAMMDSKAAELAAYMKEAEKLGAYDNGVKELAERLGGDVSGPSIVRFLSRASGNGDPVSSKLQSLMDSYTARHIDTMNTKLRIAAPNFRQSMSKARELAIAGTARR